MHNKYIACTGVYIIQASTKNPSNQIALAAFILVYEWLKNEGVGSCTVLVVSTALYTSTNLGQSKSRSEKQVVFI